MSVNSDSSKERIMVKYCLLSDKLSRRRRTTLSIKLMNIKSFLKLVEIQTKLASMLPLLLGTFYALLRYESFSLPKFLIMFFSLLCIDMATTAVNNYMDFKKAVKKQGFGYEMHNAIVRDQLTEAQVVITIVILLLLAAAGGLLLVYMTDYFVLLLGAVSLGAGLLYSAGPVPISRTPFGEIFSGGFMGLLIPFIAIYIQAPAGELINWSLSWQQLGVIAAWQELIWIALITWPAAAGIANIMLANNICDLDDDIANRRYTLPSYIGTRKALVVFRVLYYSGYAAVIPLIVFGIVSWPIIVFYLSIIPVEKNIRKFFANQSKQETFVLAVQNFAVMAASLVASVLLQLLINRIF